MSLAALSGNILAHAKRKVAGSHVAAKCARELETCLSWALQAQANGGQCDASGIKAELGVCSYLASLNEETPERSAAYLQRAEDILKAAHPAKDPEARLYLAFALQDKSRQQNGLNGQDANLLFTLLEDV